MKNWSKQQQEVLDQLTAQKENATNRLRDDIAALLNEKYEEYAENLIATFIVTHGQELLDMLIVHFNVTSKQPDAPQLDPIPVRKIRDKGHAWVPNFNPCDVRLP